MNSQLEDDTTGRRERLMAAVEQEDWSAVINAQTRQTVTPRPEAEVAAPQAAATQEVVSPFDEAKPSNTPPPPQQDDDDLPLTPENVDKVRSRGWAAGWWHSSPTRRHIYLSASQYKCDGSVVWV